MHQKEMMTFKTLGIYDPQSNIGKAYILPKDALIFTKKNVK